MLKEKEEHTMRVVPSHNKKEMLDGFLFKAKTAALVSRPSIFCQIVFVEFDTCRNKPKENLNLKL